MADEVPWFGIRDEEGWETAALKPGKWREIVMEGGHKFMATWRTEEEERLADFHRKKRGATAPGVTSPSLTPPNCAGRSISITSSRKLPCCMK